MKKIKNLKIKYLRFHNRSLFLIEAAYTLFFLLLLVPFAGHIIELIMKLSDISYITPENALSVLTSPHALILLLILCAVFTLFQLMKLSSLIYYCTQEGKRKKPFLLNMIGFSAVSSLRSLRKSLRMPLFLLSLTILSDLPVLLGIIIHTNLEFTANKTEEVIIKSFLLLLLLLIGSFAYRGLFTIHFSITQQLPFQSAWYHSGQLLKGKRLQLLSVLTLYNLIFFPLFSLFYYALLFFTATGVYLFGDRTLAVTVFLSSYPRISIYATLFFSLIGFAFHTNLITSLFYRLREDTANSIPAPPSDYEYSFRYRNKRHKWFINAALSFMLLLCLYNLYISIRHSSSYLDEILSGITICSHRGNSQIAPENTLPAIKSAIQADSDYVEIDVQLSKDKTLVLMHDKNLKRTAGINSFIWELTDQELHELDVGVWFSLDYLNTKIPTLNEVLVYCKDKIKLNIEIKINDDAESMVRQLVTLIDKYHYEDQCVVTSTNYTALREVKKYNENIKTGLILSAVFGSFYHKQYIDFFSIRYSFINQNIVKEVHKAGKEIHAWTVNTSRELERMKSAGVDAVITDNPSLAREILYRDNTNDSFIQLIRRMLKNRSFYQLSQFLH